MTDAELIATLSRKLGYVEGQLDAIISELDECDDVLLINQLMAICLAIAGDEFNRNDQLEAKDKPKPKQAVEKMGHF